MYKLLKPILFSIDPEQAHLFTMEIYRYTYNWPILPDLIRGSHPSKIWKAGPVEVAGLEFPNPVGLAAGFDKDGQYVDALASLGFGFIEVGTVTPRPQSGNPSPRLFRLPRDRALINRMGFNNYGVDALVGRLRHRQNRQVVIGGNIGKNKDTPNEEAVEDYLYCLRALQEEVDYFVINVSSPNTPGLRSLQSREPLRRLLGELQEANAGFETPRPIFLKIAPDMDDRALDVIVETAVEARLSGLIATNTTVERSGLRSPEERVVEIGEGGLSGAPLRERARTVLEYLAERLPKEMSLIGVGGIMSAEDALQRVRAGADLVQVYTGMIYEGPRFPGSLIRALSSHWSERDEY